MDNVKENGVRVSADKRDAALIPITAASNATACIGSALFIFPPGSDNQLAGVEGLIGYVKSTEQVKSMGPIRSIRRYCLDCCLGSRNEVDRCPIEDCPLHLYRFGKKPLKLRWRPLKAIHLRCLDCADNLQEIRNCPFPDCFLYHLRSGKNPALKGRRKSNVSRHVNPLNQEELRVDVEKIHSNTRVLVP
jgi:hypothetical protein